MNEIVTFETENGEIHIELSEKPKRGGTTRSGNSSKDKKVIKKFENAVKVVKEIGDSIISTVKEIKNSPDEISVEVGVKFSAELGAFVAKSSAEGTLKLNLTWKNTKNVNNDGK